MSTKYTRVMVLTPSGKRRMAWAWVVGEVLTIVERRYS